MELYVYEQLSKQLCEKNTQYSVVEKRYIRIQWVPLSLTLLFTLRSAGPSDLPSTKNRMLTGSVGDYPGRTR